MNWNLLWLFIGLNIANVIIQTIKSIATLKCGKVGASVINAVAYGFYTIVTIYMLCDLPLWWKAAIVAICNLVGVYIVKWGEEKARKDRLWKVEATVNYIDQKQVDTMFDAAMIPHNYIEAGPYTIFNCYCTTKAESEAVKTILGKFDTKYFVSESKIL